MTHKQHIDMPNTVKHYMDMAKMIGRTMEEHIVINFYIKTDDETKPKLFFDYLYYDLNMCDCNEYGILYSIISDITIHNFTATCKISYEDNIQKFSIYIDKAENKLNMDMLKDIIKRSMDHSLWMPYSEFLNKGMLNKCEKLRLYAYDLTNDNGDCVELVSDISKLLDCPVMFYKFTEPRSISIYIDTEDFRNDNHMKKQEFIKNYAMEVKQNG